MWCLEGVLDHPPLLEQRLVHYDALERAVRFIDTEGWLTVARALVSGQPARLIGLYCCFAG